jgi:putative colanic acid biosynthesis glycosyltransferase
MSCKVKIVSDKITQYNIKISVVTVVFNDKQSLEKTIQSVINQTHDNIEYIIIDGGSTDGTIDIIKKYEDKIDRFISEKDSGIYDAMNKAIDIASGDWINFMNAGDVFYDNNVIEKIFISDIEENVVCIYGDSSINYGSFKITRKSGILEHLNKGMQFSHQSLFVNSHYHKENKFDLQLKLAADYNFIYSTYVAGDKFIYKKLIVSRVTSGGVSDVKRLNSIIEAKKVVLSKRNTFLNRVYFNALFLKISFTNIIKQIIPIKLTQYIQGKML